MLGGEGPLSSRTPLTYRSSASLTFADLHLCLASNEVLILFMSRQGSKSQTHPLIIPFPCGLSFSVRGSSTISKICRHLSLDTIVKYFGCHKYVQYYYPSFIVFEVQEENENLQVR
ncbi:hypothetical protein AVEN_102990-1 [Araneus ventricosus]|uniref:Uncharacterized protein n=1 Tax=Araneus ventricosus TaxID=182803 RepID=A0A4Y2B967_ARAVE|nr:hypothetical protein AVEN_102990-1 [Araneus ventricosus]